MSQTSLRPRCGARYALEFFDEGSSAQGAEAPAGESGKAGALVYRGFVHLPDADVPVEVRIAEGGAAQASVEAGAIPAGGPSPADLERMAAALVKTVVKSAAVADRPPPRRVVRWRG